MNYYNNVDNHFQNYRRELIKALEDKDPEKISFIIASIQALLPKGYRSRLKGKRNKRNLVDLMIRLEKQISRFIKKYGEKNC